MHSRPQVLLGAIPGPEVWAHQRRSCLVLRHALMSSSVKSGLDTIETGLPVYLNNRHRQPSLSGPKRAANSGNTAPDLTLYLRAIAFIPASRRKP